MKSLISILFFLFAFLNSFGQNESEVKYRFAKEVFNSKEYSRVNYERYSGQVELVNLETYPIGDAMVKYHTYRFGDKILQVQVENPALTKLFVLGIFNPDAIFGEKTIKLSKTKFDSLDKAEKRLFNHIRNDSLRVSSFEELESLNPGPKTKRFKFWVWRIGFANPSEYYIEFYNDKATKETELSEFIENSNMRFYYKGTIIL